MLFPAPLSQTWPVMRERPSGAASKLEAGDDATSEAPCRVEAAGGLFIWCNMTTASGFDWPEVELWLFRYFQTGVPTGSPFRLLDHYRLPADRHLLCLQMEAHFGGDILYQIREHPIFTMH